MEALRQIENWGAANAAAGVLGGAVRGEVGHRFAWASVTKVATALACLVAVEEGALDLDEPAGPPGSTVRHLLAHASGLGPGGQILAQPGARRIYSNHGFVVLSEALAAASGTSFRDYLAEAVLGPLGMSADLRGDAGAGLEGTLPDLLALGRELVQPGLVSAETLDEATTVAFPGLDGVLPGFGRQRPNDWGLGVELRGTKSPHWTGRRNSPATFGHFGQSGTFVWIDPDAGVVLACLTDRPFGDWAVEAWPSLSDAVLAERAG